MGKLRETSVNPIPIIVAAVLLVAACGYIFFIRPGREADDIKKKWNTEEAAMQRGPNKPADPKLEELAAQLRAKENVNRPIGSRRRDRE